LGLDRAVVKRRNGPDVDTLLTRMNLGRGVKKRGKKETRGPHEIGGKKE